MLPRTMCFEREPRDWSMEKQTDTEEEEDTPLFLNEESDAETELLTDGGDE